MKKSLGKKKIVPLLLHKPVDLVILTPGFGSKIMILHSFWIKPVWNRIITVRPQEEVLALHYILPSRPLVEHLAWWGSAITLGLQAQPGPTWGQSSPFPSPHKAPAGPWHASPALQATAAQWGAEGGKQVGGGLLRGPGQRAGGDSAPQGVIAAEWPASELAVQARDPWVKSEPSASPKLGCEYLDISLLRKPNFSILFYSWYSQVAERIASEEIFTHTEAIRALGEFSLQSSSPSQQDCSKMFLKLTCLGRTLEKQHPWQWKPLGQPRVCKTKEGFSQWPLDFGATLWSDSKMWDNE